MCYRSNTSIVLFPWPLYYWKNLTTHPCGKLILMSITNQWPSLLLNSHARKHCYSDKPARNGKSHFLLAFFHVLLVEKLLGKKSLYVHKLVPFMINFRGFLIKQEQPGCCHAIVVSNRQSGWAEVVGKKKSCKAPPNASPTIAPFPAFFR